MKYENNYRNESIAKLDRVQQLREEHRQLCDLIEGPDTSVSCNMHKPFDHTGSITLEADDLIFLAPKSLAQMISRTDNVEVYPLTKRKVRMTLNYTDLV